MPVDTPSALQLRLATQQDAEILLAWRNDEATRQASHHQAIVERGAHLAWLEASLRNPRRQIFIAERDGVPVGTARADTDDTGVCELSWTVAPAARGTGVGKQMVCLLAKRLPGPLRAEVKEGNASSAAIAQAAGLTLARTVDGVQHFERPPLAAGQ